MTDLNNNKNEIDIFELIDNGLTEQVITQLHADSNLINAISDDELTLFETLLKAGFTKVAAQLIEMAEFDVNHLGHSPLRTAIDTGNVDIATDLLKKGASPNYRPEGMSSALLLCLENEYFELAASMVEFGAEVDIRNDLGWTPLIWASMKGRLKAVEFLLASGANIHAVNNDGWNAVTGAYFKKQTGIVSLLLEKGAVFSEKYAEAALLSAYDNGYKDVVEYLINEMEVNPNITDDDNETLLTKAVVKGDWPVVKNLLNKNANPNVFDSNGLPLIALLARDGHNELIELLLAKGADIHLRSDEGLTAIYMAAKHNQASTLTLLAEKGANINVQNENGRTPLMTAALIGSKEVVELLLELGANVHLITTEKKNAKEMVKTAIILKKNVDPVYKEIIARLTLPGHYVD